MTRDTFEKAKDILEKKELYDISLEALDRFNDKLSNEEEDFINTHIHIGIPGFYSSEYIYMPKKFYKRLYVTIRNMLVDEINELEENMKEL